MEAISIHIHTVIASVNKNICPIFQTSSYFRISNAYLINSVQHRQIIAKHRGMKLKYSISKVNLKVNWFGMRVICSHLQCTLTMRQGIIIRNSVLTRKADENSIYLLQLRLYRQVRGGTLSKYFPFPTLLCSCFFFFEMDAFDAAVVDKFFIYKFSYWYANIG